MERQHPVINATDKIFCHQTAKYACSVDDEIAKARMPARYEQLQEFNEASEDDEINRQQATLPLEP